MRRKSRTKPKCGFNNLLILFLIFQSVSLSSQTWQTIVDSCTGSFDQLRMFQNSSNEYFSVGRNSTIKLSKEGEFVFLDNDFKANIFQEGSFKIFGNCIYNFQYFSDNTVQISGYDFDFEKKSEFWSSFEVLNKQIHIIGDSIYTSSFDTLTQKSILELYNSNGVVLANFETDSEFIPYHTSGFRGFMSPGPHGNLLFYRNGQNSPLWMLDRDLSPIWKLELGEVLYISNAVITDESGNIFLYGKIDGNDKIIKISEFGEILSEGAASSLDNNVEHATIDGIATNGKTVAVKHIIPDLAHEMQVDCYDENLNLINSFYKDNGGYWSNLITNPSGGYTFGYAERKDEFDLHSDKRPVFYAIDQYCNLIDTNSILNGTIYLDENQNSIFDVGERPLKNIKVSLLPDSISRFTDANGKFRFNILRDTQKVIINLPDSCFSSNLSEIPIIKTEVRDDVEFPLTSISNDENYAVDFTQLFWKCSTATYFSFDLRNTGCTSISGDLRIELPQILVDQGNLGLYEFKVEDLPPTYGKTFYQKLNLPDENSTDDTITFDVTFSHQNIVDTFQVTSVIRCAFDPNDISVLPARETENYTLKDEKIYYSVRFQNIGNDTAQNVRIENIIPMGLDLNSLEFVSSSHEYYAEILDGRKLILHFPNIDLVDSLTNEVESNGFLKYNIKAIDTAVDLSQISNSAAIFFDSNSPVYTNTVTSTLVSTLDFDQDSIFFWEDCDDTNASIFPGAEEIPNNQIDENCDGIVLIIDDDMDGFHSDEDCDDLDSLINPLAEEIPNNGIDENCDGELQFIDEDMDGFNSDEDCNDLDSLVNSMATEIANNEIDENCDGEILIIDEDNDGFNSDDDCNDSNANINPEAEEIADNGIDENCDGEDLISSAVGQVENQVLKIYPNPSFKKIYIENNISDSYTLTIYRIDGTVALNRKVNIGEKSIDQELVSGLYYFIAVFDNSENVVNTKIVIY